MLITFYFFISIFSLADGAEKQYVKKYYANGNIQEEGWMQGSYKVDYWIFYYANGKVKEKGHYSGNLKDKYWYFYTKDGALESEGHFSKDKKNGWWSYFSTSGDIIHKCQLSNHVKNGYCFHYKENKIVKASKYSQGIKEDEWTDLSIFMEENNLSDLR